MKKNYICPLTETINIRTQSHLMDPSATGTNMSSSTGFTTPIEVGGTTTSADSRRFDIWGDDEEE